MKVVVGTGFGDEGKGLTTDFLCSEALSQGLKPVVFRFNGGHQAGHTVQLDGRRHVFSNFGSGTLRKVPTVWGQHCTFYPTSFLEELELLRDLEPDFYAHPVCPLVTPLDVMAGQNRERKLNHGSVGVGFGATLQRNEDHCNVFVQDIFYPAILRIKLELVCKYYELQWSEEMEMFFNDCMACREHIKLAQELRIGSDFAPVFEGAQGLMLDQKFGFFPHVTRSNCGSRNAFIMSRLANGRDPKLNEVWYVTRTYSTRHGNGPLPGEGERIKITNNENESNVENEFQRNFRVAPLSADVLNYAIHSDALYVPSNFKRCLMVTCNDQHPIDIGQLLDSFSFKFERVCLSFGPSAVDVKQYTALKLPA
jgi:adenylosuccinate synthase